MVVIGIGREMELNHMPHMSSQQHHTTINLVNKWLDQLTYCILRDIHTVHIQNILSDGFVVGWGRELGGGLEERQAELVEEDTSELLAGVIERDNPDDIG